MSNIKSITQLTGAESKTDWNFSNAKITAELDLSNPKNIRGMQLSRDGLVLYKGKTFLAIPASELWKLAESIEPAFMYSEPVRTASVPPQPKEASAK